MDLRGGLASPLDMVGGVVVTGAVMETEVEEPRGAVRTRMEEPAAPVLGWAGTSAASTAPWAPPAAGGAVGPGGGDPHGDGHPGGSGGPGRDGGGGIFRATPRSGVARGGHLDPKLVKKAQQYDGAETAWRLWKLKTAGWLSTVDARPPSLARGRGDGGACSDIARVRGARRVLVHGVALLTAGRAAGALPSVSRGERLRGVESALARAGAQGAQAASREVGAALAPGVRGRCDLEAVMVGVGG